MIVVIDYNVGNVRSVCGAFRHLGYEAQLSCEPKVVEEAWGLVLPGVAAFGYAINALGPLGELIKQLAQAGKPLLGICVGYQMLFDESCEYGTHRGLGLVSGNVPSRTWTLRFSNKDSASFLLVVLALSRLIMPSALLYRMYHVLPFPL